MDAAFVTGRLAAVVRTTPAGQVVVLDEWTRDGGTITLSVDLATFVDMFADVDVTGTPEQIRDGMLAADQVTVHLDAAGNVVDADSPDAVGTETRSRGYAGYIGHWHDTGLLGPVKTPRQAPLPSGLVVAAGVPVAS